MDSSHKYNSSLDQNFDEINSNLDTHCSPVQASLSSMETQHIHPRKYQLEVFEVARKQNTIAVLETGSGKTFIAVMLINDIGQSIKYSGVKKLIIFLAPTVHLQFKIIKDLTNFDVEEYYGAKGVDTWNLERWEKEINDHDVLIMTPQILLDALRKAFINIETVCLIIIDECHRATGNHPYAKIMKEFYHKANVKPKIFGMTASPVIKKGVSSTMDCKGQISELENILESEIYTIEDRTEMDACIPSAKESCRYYDQAQPAAMSLKSKIEALWSESDIFLSELQKSLEGNYKDVDDKFKGLHKRMSNDLAKILYCLEDLGLLCTYEAVQISLEKFHSIEDEHEAYRKGFLHCKYFLENVMQIVGESLPLADKSPLEVGFDYTGAVTLGYISPKLHELIQIFQSFGKSSHVSCLIFVERIITAKVIERFVRKVSQLSHFAVSYVTGSNTSNDSLALKRQKETLDSFRTGKVNLLFTTDVIEEGIHVPGCSSVIRFDLPKTIRSYVQSRGRARQANSQFIMMLERGNSKHISQLFDIIKSERFMTDDSLNSGFSIFTPRACTVEEAITYSVDSTGASVTSDSSVTLIHQYCGKLKGDMYFNPKPIFESFDVEGGYQCKLSLPPNAAFQTIVGPLGRNAHLAKQLVCLEACKKLHKMGALDDHLRPSVEEPLVQVQTVKSKKTSSGAGTTKRKELHGSASIRALCGTWKDKLDGAIFHAYTFDFTCNVLHDMYSGFVLLIESKLDDDVGNFELELYLISKIVKTSVSSCGQVHLDAEQMKNAKSFHELLYNGVFGRLVFRSKEGGGRKFLLQDETSSLWTPSNLYLLLPLEKDGIDEESLKINWAGINSCASAIEFMRKRCSLGIDHCNDYRKNLPSHDISLLEADCGGREKIHFANFVLDVNNVKDMVVLAIHTGRIYCIIEVAHDLCAESPFDGTTEDVAAAERITFSDYYSKRYGITLRHPGQPLLLLRQSHNPHNLLVNFNEDDTLGKSPEGGLVTQKARAHVHIPPELLCTLDVRRDVLKSLYLLPSLMHRLESFMLASQLRQEVAGQDNNYNIPSSLILEALTTVRCCEKFSMERLELLGDSVLKYAVSCHLFLKYPKKHEGQLSAQRTAAVCNSTLHKCGTDHKIQEYIRDFAFEPRRWVAPGQNSIHTVHCKCGVENLEVPLDEKFQSEDPKIVVGKFCDRRHRWICSKTIADCVEALIGAYYVGGGLLASLHVMKWLGICAGLEPSLVDEAITVASLHIYSPKENEIASLEAKIGYKFSVKGLLLEAITHASENELGGGYCYERLEFLGDSVLDLLITWHLYQSHTSIDPGELTDLRAASVNNENFAQVAVRQNLQQYLLHSSDLLLGQINDYVRALSESNMTKSLPGFKGPKVLGDLVESIAGAILIDTKLNLDEVWKVFKPLLSPIVTPDKLELPPLRELLELSSSLGYFVKEKCKMKGDMVHAELSLQLQDVLLVREGWGPNRKTAKGEAAFHLLKELEKRGISHSNSGTKRKRDNPDHFFDSSSGKKEFSICAGLRDEHVSEPLTYKRAKKDKTNLSAPNDLPTELSDPNDAIPVIASINMKKGGPRTTLFELCKRLQWPMPTFDSAELKQRTPFEFGEGSERRKGYICFVSSIQLCIPNYGNIDCRGDSRADKKSSLDSAALEMLYELQRLGKLKIGDF
ncbi:endoribonuclease Dicer homolog 3a [Neltuma alba]|uniref:endoribonuclease Dicer homolog 3a n=1 Tax=Neltuma alba TaxID=207710 RepID=UPI0010A3847A|nr:endoribonuclease Dicer homolog 3a-like [Prosopis alba]